MRPQIKARPVFHGLNQIDRAGHRALERAMNCRQTFGLTAFSFGNSITCSNFNCLFSATAPYNTLTTTDQGRIEQSTSGRYAFVV